MFSQNSDLECLFIMRAKAKTCVTPPIFSSALGTALLGLSATVGAQTPAAIRTDTYSWLMPQYGEQALAWAKKADRGHHRQTGGDARMRKCAPRHARGAGHEHRSAALLPGGPQVHSLRPRSGASLRLDRDCARRRRRTPQRRLAPGVRPGCLQQDSASALYDQMDHPHRGVVSLRSTPGACCRCGRTAPERRI